MNLSDFSLGWSQGEGRHRKIKGSLISEGSSSFSEGPFGPKGASRPALETGGAVWIDPKVDHTCTNAKVL